MKTHILKQITRFFSTGHRVLAIQWNIAEKYFVSPLHTHTHTHSELNSHANAGCFLSLPVQHGCNLCFIPYISEISKIYVHSGGRGGERLSEPE